MQMKQMTVRFAQKLARQVLPSHAFIGSHEPRFQYCTISVEHLRIAYEWQNLRNRTSACTGPTMRYLYFKFAAKPVTIPAVLVLFAWSLDE